MSPDVQIAIDADDPHMLNRFWAAVMGYEVEDHHDQATQVLDAGYATVDDTVEIDGRRAWKTAAACRATSGRGVRLLFQHVPEAKSVKNRVHLDLHVGTEDRDAEVARIVGLGATHLWDGQQGPQTWVTLADPEGNEFCVA
ncbi:MAG: VOC family protein [Actinomycetota bacterium]|nr:VOC family protein [Actinomycetota bacterium]